MMKLDEPLLRAVQQTLPVAYADIAGFFNLFLHQTGIPVLWVLSLGGFLALRRYDYAALFLLLLAVSPLTALLKQIVDRPRPAGDFTVLEFPANPSFPSGHTTRSLAFFGLWFLVSSDVLPRWAALPVRAGCVAAVFFTGLSRVWAGAHWPSDVLGSLVWGSLFLALLMMTRPFFNRLNPPRTTA